MASPNEIAGLQQIAVKPAIWLITEVFGEYSVAFSWYQGDKTEFISVQSQRAGQRIYKSLNTVMTDIRKVDPNALVQLSFAS